MFQTNILNSSNNISTGLITTHSSLNNREITSLHFAPASALCSCKIAMKTTNKSQLNHKKQYKRKYYQNSNNCRFLKFRLFLSKDTCLKFCLNLCI